MFPFDSRPEGRYPTDEEQNPETVGDAIDTAVIMGDRVLAYRVESLVAVGLTPHQSRALALDRRVDIHFVTDRLIKRGCAPDLAFDIASF